MENTAREYYESRYGSLEGISFTVLDYGCHTVIEVYESGVLVNELGYGPSGIFEC